MNLSRRRFLLLSGAAAATAALPALPDIPMLPSPWIPCDGRLVSKKLYPKLWEIVGTAWDGDDKRADEFRIPNLKPPHHKSFQYVMATKDNTNHGFTPTGYVMLVPDKTVRELCS